MVAFCLNVIAYGTTYYVSTDGNDLNDGLSWATAFATIQKGIDSAGSGDIVDVNSGTYSETIDFNGVSCTLQSVDPNDWDTVAATIINANDANLATVTFDSGEDVNSVIKGFTLTGGNYGISLSNSSSPVINKCLIIDANLHGIYCTSGSPEISQNKIGKNTGYGIYSSATTPPTIKNNWIYDNDTGVYVTGATSAGTIRNNTIVDNTTYGIYLNTGTAPTISNCIVWDCNDDLYNCSATYSGIEDGDSGTGNILSYPYFADYDANDFYLTWNSPCVNRGDPNTSTSGTDIDGDSRVVDGRIDMGADELNLVANLLKNGDFECADANGEPCDWVNFSGSGDTSTERQIVSDGYDGNCVRISSPLGGDYGIKQVVGNLIPGREYAFSVWCKGTTKESITLRIIDPNWTGGNINFDGLQQMGSGNWTKMTTFFTVPMEDANGQPVSDDEWEVALTMRPGDFNYVTFDSAELSLASMYLPAYGCVNEPNVAVTVEFGGTEQNIGCVNDLTVLQSSETDPCDGNIEYRELKAGKTLLLEIPAFNLDPEDNNWPATPMLLEIMFKDTNEAEGDDLVVYSGLFYPTNDPNIPYSGRGKEWPGMLVSERSGMDRWKFAQVAFAINDFLCSFTLNRDGASATVAKI
jgi:parallel beta-helix repeat protein